MERKDVSQTCIIVIALLNLGPGGVRFWLGAIVLAKWRYVLNRLIGVFGLDCIAAQIFFWASHNAFLYEEFFSKISNYHLWNWKVEKLKQLPFVFQWKQLFHCIQVRTQWQMKMHSSGRFRYVLNESLILSLTSQILSPPSSSEIICLWWNQLKKQARHQTLISSSILSQKTMLF